MSDLETRLKEAIDRRAYEVTPRLARESLLREVRQRRRTRGLVWVASAGATVAVVLSVVAVGLSWKGAGQVSDAPAAGTQRWSGRVEDLPASPLAARRDATAVWTGSEVLVWGGMSGNQLSSTYFADGAAFDPVSRSWRPLPKSPLTARARQQAVWTGSEMLIWGGEGTQHGPQGLVDGAAYNPKSGTWRRIADAPGEGRASAQAWVVSGKVVTAGGQSSQGVSAARQVLVYDVAADRWLTFQVPGRVEDAVPYRGGLIVANLDDSNHIRLAHVGLDGRETGLVSDPALTFSVERVSLSLAGDTLFLAVTNIGANRVQILSGTQGSDEKVSVWHRMNTSTLVKPSIDISTGQRDVAVALSPRALMLAGLPEIAVVDPLRGTVLYRSALSDAGGYCGAGSAEVWTGTFLFAWGGQLCRGGDPVDATSKGVALVSRS